MKNIFGLDALEVIDNVFMCDNIDNTGNVIGPVFTEKFDYQPMREFFLKKFDEIPKLRKKLVKKHGSYWFQDIDDEEWAIKK